MYFDPKLVQRLNRPLQRPGVTNHRMAEHLIARSQYFLDRLPLLDQQLSRWSTVVELDPEQVPIVYVENSDPEVLETEPLKTPDQRPLEVPTKREAPSADHPLIPPTPAHSTEAQSPVQPPITPEPAPRTQPILEPVNPHLQGEGLIQAQQPPESRGREVHHPAPPTNRKARKQARKQARQQARQPMRSEGDKTATPPQTAIPQPLTPPTPPPTQPSETATLAPLVVQPTPTPSPDLPSPREQNPLDSFSPALTSPHSEPALSPTDPEVATPALPSVGPIPQALTPLTPLGGEGIIQAKPDPNPERTIPPLLSAELPPTESANLPTPPHPRTLPQTHLEPQQPILSVHPNRDTDFTAAHPPSTVLPQPLESQPVAPPSQGTLETPRVSPTPSSVAPSPSQIEPLVSPSPTQREQVIAPTQREQVIDPSPTPIEPLEATPGGNPVPLQPLTLRSPENTIIQARYDLSTPNITPPVPVMDVAPNPLYPPLELDRSSSAPVVWDSVPVVQAQPLAPLPTRRDASPIPQNVVVPSQPIPVGRDERESLPPKTATPPPRDLDPSRSPVLPIPLEGYANIHPLTPPSDPPILERENPTLGRYNANTPVTQSHPPQPSRPHSQSFVTSPTPSSPETSEPVSAPVQQPTLPIIEATLEPPPLPVKPLILSYPNSTVPFTFRGTRRTPQLGRDSPSAPNSQPPLTYPNPLVTPLEPTPLTPLVPTQSSADVAAPKASVVSQEAPKNSVFNALQTVSPVPRREGEGQGLSEVDLEALVTKVERKILKRLVVESERRGKRKWL
ncbi:hypothetical protein [Spirulina subsalsa]|uniref:hypothetical protein n=1 Tax=Spirulina subsalsa TaxID=54311 RepID=UPI00030FFAB9|nr:hypothetical protein [Spirulina subsalsa]